MVSTRSDCMPGHGRPRRSAFVSFSSLITEMSITQSMSPQFTSTRRASVVATRRLAITSPQSSLVSSSGVGSQRDVQRLRREMKVMQLISRDNCTFRAVLQRHNGFETQK
jgi:hypothetical protein